MSAKVQQKQVMKKYFRNSSSSALSSFTDLAGSEQDQKLAPFLVWFMAFFSIGGMFAVYMGLAKGELALTFIISAMIAGAAMCKLRRTFL